VQKSLMPKGVDHMFVSFRIGRFAGVQKSLMPKGVDHPHYSVHSGRWLLCKNL